MVVVVLYVCNFNSNATFTFWMDSLPCPTEC
jgi:hypothetical protein